MQPKLRLAVPKTASGDLELPPCLTPNVLYQLAKTMERLEVYHRERGGREPELPCLRSIHVDKDGHVCARILSGGLTFKMELVAGAWVFV